MLPILSLLVVMLGVHTGCVQRTIRVTSEPTGAIVWLNHQEVGRTPVDVGFVHYGDYDVRLEKAGYEPLVTNARVRAPLWDLPGPDLVAELIPVPMRSTVHVHFDLVPSRHPDYSDRDGLIERASALRGRTEAMPRPVVDRETLMRSIQPIRIRPAREREDASVHEFDPFSDDPLRD